MKTFAKLLLCCLLAGCASPDYDGYESTYQLWVNGKLVTHRRVRYRREAMEMVEFVGRLVTTTKKAVLFSIDEDDVKGRFWFPRQAVDYGGAEEPKLVVGQEYTFEITRKLAIEKDLLDEDDE